MKTTYLILDISSYHNVVVHGGRTTLLGLSLPDLVGEVTISAYVAPTLLLPGDPA